MAIVSSNFLSGSQRWRDFSQILARHSINFYFQWPTHFPRNVLLLHIFCSLLAQHLQSFWICAQKHRFVMRCISSVHDKIRLFITKFEAIKTFLYPRHLKFLLNSFAGKNFTNHARIVQTVLAYSYHNLNYLWDLFQIELL